jgi:site-specific DNA-methyltransferase (adenine-specific)
MSGREINDYAAFTPLPFSPYLDLRHCDCMDYMRGLPDKAFALAIVDPPYGIGAANMTMGSGIHAFTKGKQWDNCIPDAPYFDELFRVSKNQIVWGGNYFNLPPSRCFLIWDKGEGFYNRSYAECEMAWTSFDANAKIFKRNPLAMGDYKGKIHPTQKPVALYRWLLANYARPGDTILDTHMGSGSIAIACHYAGHRLTACELDAEYYRDALERVERETRQQTLFTPPIADPEQEHGCELL